MNGSPVPRRALIVSADIGAGHNSAGRALEEAMARAWAPQIARDEVPDSCDDRRRPEVPNTIF